MAQYSFKNRKEYIIIRINRITTDGIKIHLTKVGA